MAPTLAIFRSVRDRDARSLGSMVITGRRGGCVQSSTEGMGIAARVVRRKQVSSTPVAACAVRFRVLSLSQGVSL